jgi:hypothetical protein
LTSARDGGLYETAARVVAPTIIEITPTAELVWFAEEAGRVLIFTGAPEQAMVWYNLADQESAGVPEAELAKARLWPLTLLSELEERTPLDGAMTEAWMKQKAMVSLALQATSQEGDGKFLAASAKLDPDAGYRTCFLVC